MATRITRPEFEAFVHPLIKDIVEATEKYNLPENAKKWFSDVGDGLITGIFFIHVQILTN
jgi:farnesyl diphosphate synthase